MSQRAKVRRGRNFRSLQAHGSSARDGSRRERSATGPRCERWASVGEGRQQRTRACPSPRIALAPEVAAARARGARGGRSLAPGALRSVRAAEQLALGSRWPSAAPALVCVGFRHFWYAGHGLVTNRLRRNGSADSRFIFSHEIGRPIVLSCKSPGSAGASGFSFHNSKSLA